MAMYNLIEYSNIYSKISGSLWQYYRDETISDDINNSIDFPANKQGKQKEMAQNMFK